MAITFVAAGAVNSGNGNNPITPANPAGIVDGDLIFLVAETSANNPVATITTPTGWASLSGTPNVSPLTQTATRLYVWYRIRSGVYTAPALSPSVSDHIVAVQVAYRGVDPNNPFDVTSASTSGTSATVAFASVTTASPNTMVVLVAGRDEDRGSTNAITTAPTGYAERVDTNVATGNGGGIFVADLTRAASGLYSPVPSATAQNSSAYVAFTIALRPILFASASRTFDRFTVSGTSTVTGRAASANLTLDRFTVSGTSTVATNSASASASLTFNPITLSSTTEVTGLVGSASITLGELFLTGSTQVPVAAQAERTFSPFTVSGTGSVVAVTGVTANASLFFDPLTLSSTTEVTGRIASANLTLGELFLTGSTQVPVAAQAERAFGPLTLSGTVAITGLVGSANLTFDPLTSNGTVTIVTVATNTTSASLTFDPFFVTGLVTSAVADNTLDSRKLFRLRRSTRWRDRFYRV